MARRHHRRYRGLVAANLGALGLNRSVGASDVAVGVAIGVVGAGAARWVENSVLPASWKAYLMQPSGFWAWIHANSASFKGLITRDPGGGSRHLQGPSSESSNLAGLSRFTAARARMMS